MPPRSSWKGFLRLSLVSVPVKAYTANATGSEIRLNQLHRKTHNRIRYQKVDPDEGVVSSDDIVNGYEYAKGQYVVIDPKEISKLRASDEKAISIDGFVKPDVIDPVYFAGKTYYLVPDGAVGQKPYALLRQGMKDANVFALAEIILSGREQVVLIRPLDSLILMTVLNYSEKIKSADGFRDEVADPSYTPEELSLTRTLIDASLIQELDFSAFKDTYIAKLTELIEKKVSGEEIISVRDPEEPKIMNLMEALKQSVRDAQKSASHLAPSAKSKEAKPTKRKMAGSTSKKKTASKAKPKKKASTSRTQKKTG